MLIDEPGGAQMRYRRTILTGTREYHYFVARVVPVIVVCETSHRSNEGNVTLRNLTGRVVDVSLDVDTQPDRYTVLKQNTGKPHRRAIIHKKMTGKGFDLTLTQFLDDMKPNGQE
jgi:hypothetical protein